MKAERNPEQTYGSQRLLSIGMISMQDPSIPGAWSGTIGSMYHALLRQYRVTWIPASEPFHIGLIGRLLTVILRAFGRNLSRFHLQFTARAFAKSVADHLSGHDDVDVLFAPAGSQFIAFLQTDIPVIYLSDATFVNMVNYYERYSGLPSWNTTSGDCIEQRAMQKACQVVFSSTWAKRSATRYYGIPASKVTVIRFAPNLDEIDTVRSPCPKVINDGKVNLLFLGVDWVRKGGDTAVDAHRILRDEYGIDCVLRIVGCSPALEPDGTIEVVGFLRKSDPLEKRRFTEILVSSHILLLPTSAECSAVAFSEAIAAGMPTVTYDTGGVTDYVLHEKTGLCLSTDRGAKDFAYAVHSLVSDSAKYTAMSAACNRFHAETLNWEHWLSEFDRVVDKIHVQLPIVNSVDWTARQDRVGIEDGGSCTVAGEQKKWNKATKFKVAIEAYKGERSVTELAEEYGVNPTQIHRWKKKLMENGPEVFAGKRDEDRRAVALERDELCRKIGDQQAQIDLLKKKLGVDQWPTFGR